MKTSNARIAALGIFLLIAGALPVSAQEAPRLPEGLNHVPHDALGFVHVRVGAFLATEPGKMLLEQLNKDKQAAKVLKEMEKKTGIALTDLESVTVIFPEWLPPVRNGMGIGPFFSPDASKKVMDPRFLDPFDKKPVFPFPDNQIPPVPKIEFKDLELLPKDNRFDRDKKKGESKKEPKIDDGKESPVVFQDIEPRNIDPILDLDRGFMEYSPLVIVTAAKAIDRKALLKSGLMGQDNHPVDFDHLSFSLGRGASVVFLSDRSVLLGPSAAILRHVHRVMNPAAPDKDGKAAAPRPLAAVLNQKAGDHLVVAGGHLPSFLRTNLLLLPRSDQMRGQLVMYYPLLSVSSARMTLDLGKAADLRLQLTASSERAAGLAAQSVKTSLASFDVIMEALQGIRKALDDLPNGKRKPGGHDAIAFLRKAVAGVAVEQEGNVVQCRLQLEVTPQLFQQLAGELVAHVKQSGDRVRSVNNLKQIALAMHNYENAYHGFPPAGLSSPQKGDGKPLLSWRVAILPFIEQEHLYRQFDLDLPWDHPHNKKLIEKMPSIYALPGVETKERGLTHYQVFVGPGTAFEQRPGGNGRTNIRIVDIPDGTSNTIMAVEAANPVIWTKPDDLPFDAKEPLPKLGGHFEDGFHAAMCDGSVHFLRRLDEKILRAMITRNGGELFSLDW